jgi:hypothetical protein
MAGALGKKAWTLLSRVADWRWMLEGETTPWYPTMRLLRQTRPGDWSDVIERMAEPLSREEWVSPENQKPETSIRRLSEMQTVSQSSKVPALVERHLKPIREVP